ncbi:hypothetical protein ACFSC4_24965 [Deinococcus malanensis]|uniref:hypothetical protein n=1 Tax=Deinococcus malanensis TaxID=1706855 RepID=UPI003640FCDB
MPYLAAALDPQLAGQQLRSTAEPTLASCDVRQVRLLRHKVGRRALVEYTLEVRPEGQPPAL